MTGIDLHTPNCKPTISYELFSKITFYMACYKYCNAVNLAKEINIKHLFKSLLQIIKLNY